MVRQTISKSACAPTVNSYIDTQAAAAAVTFAILLNSFDDIKIDSLELNCVTNCVLRVIVASVKLCSTLQQLSLYDEPAATDAVILDVLAHCNNLQLTNLRRSQITNSASEASFQAAIAQYRTVNVQVTYWCSSQPRLVAAMVVSSRMSCFYDDRESQDFSTAFNAMKQNLTSILPLLDKAYAAQLYALQDCNQQDSVAPKVNATQRH